jgi:hypothetical protein
MRREVINAVLWGIIFTTLLAILIIIGSRNLSYFDAALIGYTFAVLFAVFGIVYRYAMWPPTPSHSSLLEKRMAGFSPAERSLYEFTHMGEKTYNGNKLQ